MDTIRTLIAVSRSRVLNLTVEGAFGQDRAKDSRTGERGARDHTSSDGVDDVEHLRVGLVLRLVDPVQGESLRGTTADPAHGGDEPLPRLETDRLSGVGHRGLLESLATGARSSALPALEARVELVDDVDPPAAAHDLRTGLVLERLE